MVGALIAQIHEEVRRIWCFKWLALLTSTLILLAATPVVMSVPKVYDAWAQIYVAKETPLAKAAQGVALVGDNYGDPHVVEKTLLNDQNLETIVRRLDPTTAALSRAEMAKAVHALALHIQVAPNNDDGFFEVHVRDTDPIRAHRTVQLILNEFVSRNVTSNQQGLRQATQFLDHQIAGYRELIAQSEARMAAFRQRYPSVARLTAAAPAGSSALDLPAAQAAYATALSRGSSQPSVARAQEQIDALEAKLATLQTQYTEQHPDVIAARRQLAQAIALRNRAARQPRVIDPMVAVARQRLYSAQRLGGGAALSSPARAEWLDLTRTHEGLQANYQQLLARRDATRLSEGAGDAGAGKYQVTRRPSVPQLPIGPRRGLYLAAVVFAALAGGVATAYLRAAMKGIFVSPRELEQVLQLPVVGTVSWEPAWSTAPPRRPHERAAAELRAAFGDRQPQSTTPFLR